MADYIKRIRTEAGDLQIDYEALANLPVSDATLTQSGKFADAKAVGDRISGMSSPVTSVNSKTGAVILSASDVGAMPDTYTPPVTSVNGQTGAVNITVPNVPVTSVNGKTGAVTLSASDVGARPNTWTPTASDVGAAASSHTHSDYVTKTSFSLSGTNLTITIS